MCSPKIASKAEVYEYSKAILSWWALANSLNRSFLFLFRQHVLGGNVQATIRGHDMICTTEISSLTPIRKMAGPRVMPHRTTEPETETPSQPSGGPVFAVACRPWKKFMVLARPHRHSRPLPPACITTALGAAGYRPMLTSDGGWKLDRKGAMITTRGSCSPIGTTIRASWRSRRGRYAGGACGGGQEIGRG